MYFQGKVCIYALSSCPWKYETFLRVSCVSVLLTYVVYIKIHFILYTSLLCVAELNYWWPTFLILSNYYYNYTLYQNALFWLVDERGIFFLPILSFFQLFRHCRGICLIITLHRDACNKMCETLSVVRFIAKSYFPFLPFTEKLVAKFVKRYQLCVLCNIIR